MPGPSRGSSAVRRRHPSFPPRSCDHACWCSLVLAKGVTCFSGRPADNLQDNWFLYRASTSLRRVWRLESLRDASPAPARRQSCSNQSLCRHGVGTSVVRPAATTGRFRKQKPTNSLSRRRCEHASSLIEPDLLIAAPTEDAARPYSITSSSVITSL